MKTFRLKRIVMTAPIAAAATALTAPAAMAQTPTETLPALSIGQQTSLRCASAFAIVAQLQSSGGAQELPAIGKRGQEYFVRTMAQLMNQTGASRSQLKQLLAVEVRKLEEPALIAQIMPPCLTLLDQSGL